MTGIRYVTGDATALAVDGPVVLAHCVNSVGRWGAGFVLAVSARWPHVKADYLDWWRDRGRGDFALGATRHVAVGPGRWVANMVGQRGIAGPGNPKPIDYGALEQCLTAVAVHALRYAAVVHMPRVGCGLAGGRWADVEPLVDRCLCTAGVRVTVFDLPASGAGTDPRR